MDVSKKYSPISLNFGNSRIGLEENNTSIQSCHKSLEEQGSAPFLQDLAHHKLLSPGQTILHENGPMTSVGQILSGVVKLSKTLSDGRQQIVGLCFQADFVGSPFSEESPYHAEAVTRVYYRSYDRLKFVRGLREHRAFEHRLFQTTLGELDAAREWMLLLGRKYASEKIASFLLMVAERMQVSNQGQKSAGALTFMLPLTRTEIADFLGLTIETVSRNFSDLKAKKIVGLLPNREISIFDIDRLSALAEQIHSRKSIH